MSECKDCEKKSVTCIPFFEHENALMHKDADNERAYQECERMHKTIRCLCGTFLAITIIIIAIVITFVTSYNSRTKSWLSTLDQITRRYPVTEVVDGGNVHQQPD